MVRPARYASTISRNVSPLFNRSYHQVVLDPVVEQRLQGNLEFRHVPYELPLIQPLLLISSRPWPSRTQSSQQTSVQGWMSRGRLRRIRPHAPLW